MALRGTFSCSFEINTYIYPRKKFSIKPISMKKILFTINSRNLSPVIAADDVYIVAFFNIHLASPLEYFRSQ